ncbi:MAG: hypothetical protein HYY04_13215 [Chloroflexi bacterium]|nr:hypothetical protein [Chloroflexota bacterium]
MRVLVIPEDFRNDQYIAELHPKERYFLPLAKSRNLLEGPGEGRKTLGREAARRYGRIRARCPEDVAVLEECVRRWLGGSA